MSKSNQELLDEAVRTINASLDKKTATYRDELGDVKARLQEVEQKGAGGYHGAMPSGSEGSSFRNEIMQSDQIADYFANKGGKSARTNFNSSSIFIQNNTIIGEEGSPQEPSDTLAPPTRLPGVVPGAFRSLNFLDLIPRQGVGSNQVDYPRESSWTNNAAETAEAGTKPESDLSFDLVEEPIRTIPHIIKISRQALDDSPWLQNYVADRMLHGVRKKLQSQLINGNGTSPNISGITDSGNHTAFSPTTGDHALDSLNRAKYEVIGADYEPNFILMNPKDLGAIERLKTSSEEAYLLGTAEGARYVAQGLRGLIWELPVIGTNDIAEGKFIAGDVMALLLLMRQEAVFELFEQDSTNVQKNLLTARSELRAGLASLVPAAIQYGDLTT